MIRAHLTGFATIACLLAGCSGNPPATMMTPPLLAAPPAGQGVQLTMTDQLMPGEETQACSFFQVPAGGWAVNKQEVRYTPGSHHVLLYTTPYATIPTVDLHGKTIDTSGVFDCPNAAGGDWTVNGVAGGAQSAEAPAIVASLPAGTAFKLAPGTVLLMNTHYLNASPNPLSAQVFINLWTMPFDQVTQEAGIIFFYNPIIRINPNAMGSARISCPVTKDVTLVNAQSHMHRRGMNYLANLVDDSGPMPQTQQLYAGTAWENVVVQSYDHQTLKAGSAIDYHCDYLNPEDRTVLQGPKTTDEMCMFIGLYYPRDPGFELCSPDGTFDHFMESATWIGGGKASCGQSLTCAVTATDVAGFYSCVQSSCPSAGKAFTAVSNCLFVNKGEGQCVTQCKDMGSPDCRTCLQAHCDTQINACMSDVCK